jgi:hypothetical protein
MRNYWTRIALGALAVFMVGMVGVTLVRRGIGGVREIAEGTEPISLPVAFVPFKLDGRKLGTISRVVLHRDAPKHLTGVELEIKLTDSMLARGLEGCRLVANFDAQNNPGGVEVKGNPISTGVFTCLHGDDSTAGFQDFGHAIFQPGGVSVPLLLPNDIVDDLRQGHFTPDEDSISALAEAQADSIIQEAEALGDSISALAEARADSVVASSERLADSLRREGVRRADSTRQALSRMADTARPR